MDLRYSWTPQGILKTHCVGIFHEHPQHLALCRTAQVCTFLCKAERTPMNDEVVITYEGEQVSAPKEVAEFLEQERRREQAQARQDRRHLSKSSFEPVLSCKASNCCDPMILAERNLQLENLRKAIAELNEDDQYLISLRYLDEHTMEEIGKVFGISKMAVSKRLKKLHEKLGSSVK